MKNPGFVLLITATQILPAPAASAEEALKATYQDDFVLETASGSFKLKIRGNIHVDLRTYQAGEES